MDYFLDLLNQMDSVHMFDKFILKAVFEFCDLNSVNYENNIIMFLVFSYF